MRHKVILYNPPAVFWTMPLALLAVGSALDPEPGYGMNPSCDRNATLSQLTHVSAILPSLSR